MKTDAKPLKFRKMKSKHLMAAERRGLRIKNPRHTALNQTLNQFRSPDTRFNMSTGIGNSNVLVSDRSNMNSISQNYPFNSVNKNLPEFMARLQQMDSNEGSNHVPSSSDQSNNDDLNNTNIRYSSNNQYM